MNADTLGTWILPALARLSVAHPVVFDLHREDQDHTSVLLETGRVMAAVTSRRAPVPGCTADYLGSMRYRAVASPAYRDRWLPGRVDAAALAVAPVVAFDLHDDLQAGALRQYGVEGTPPRHFVPASSDFARAVLLGMGWGMLPDAQAEAELRRGELVELVPRRSIDVPLYWQQWNLRSELLAAIAAEVADEAKGALR